MEQKKKIALVTGGGRGLGKDMALRLAEKGLGVVITYQSRAEDANAVVAEIGKAGGTAVALQLNVGELKGYDAFFANLVEVLGKRFGAERFDFLVNNGGIGRNAAFAETEEAVFDELLSVHYKGVYFLTQKALPFMNDGGGIVNISSGLARFTGKGYSAYGSMKGAIEVLTRYLAAELGSRQIRANVVAPGAIETDFGGGHVRDNEQVNKWVASVTALGRAGQPEDIGGVVAFLCTEDAQWINAQRIEVSGGMNI